MQVSVCVGDYAVNPYSVPGLETSVYCMEELAFCLKENAFLLDSSFLEVNLPEWVERECGLPELAGELRGMLNRQTTVSAFVTMILEYVRMYEPEVINEIAQTVKEGSGLSGIEKRKSQIDYLVKKKKYPAAVHRYDELLYKWNELEQQSEEVPASKIQAAILNNKGVALTGLMEYEMAAACFLQAYEKDANKTYYDAYLAAKRMSLDEDEYVAFIANLPGSYEPSMKLERIVERIGGTYKEMEVYKMLEARKEYRHGGDRQKYYDESDRITYALRVSYRNSVSE